MHFFSTFTLSKQFCKALVFILKLHSNVHFGMMHFIIYKICLPMTCYYQFILSSVYLEVSSKFQIKILNPFIKGFLYRPLFYLNRYLSMGNIIILDAYIASLTVIRNQSVDYITNLFSVSY